MSFLPEGVCLLLAGAQQQDTSIVERSDVERGPAKTRRIASDPMVTVSGILRFKTAAAYAAYRAWFYSAYGANAGAGWWSWIDPRTATTRQVRFIPGSMGALTPLTGRYAISQQSVGFEYLETPESLGLNRTYNGDLERVYSFDPDRAFGTAPYNNGQLPVTYSRISGRKGGTAQVFNFGYVDPGSNSAQQGLYTSAEMQPAWEPNKTYVISIYMATGSETAHIGRGVRLRWNTEPAFVEALLNPPMSSSFQRYAWRVRWGVAVEGNGALFITTDEGIPRFGAIAFDDLAVTEGAELLPYLPPEPSP